METMSVLIADSSEEFRSTLANALQGNYRVHACRTGKEALDILQRTPPDVLILDLMLPELDGISLLQTVSAAGVRPTVLATTRLANDYVVEATTKLGVEYLMIKPCDIRAIVSRVNDLCCHRPRPSISAPDNRTHISNLLISLGISTKLRGYPYLREAVLRMVDNPMQSITKELYPSVEEKAAMLLYLVTKNHSFSDGNKRIAATLFLWFMAGNGILYNTDGTKRIADNTLVALTLMIAESRTEEKDVMVKVVVNLINKNNYE